MPVVAGAVGTGDDDLATVDGRCAVPFHDGWEILFGRLGCIYRTFVDGMLSFWGCFFLHLRWVLMSSPGCHGEAGFMMNMIKVLGFAEKNASKKFQKHILPNGGLFHGVIYRDVRIRQKVTFPKNPISPSKVANLRTQKTPPLLIIQVHSFTLPLATGPTGDS